MRGRHSLSVGVVLALAAAQPAASSFGGTPAPEREPTGGTAYAQPVPQVAEPKPPRPVATVFSVTPGNVTSGSHLPRIVFRIDERGVRHVHARLVFAPLGGEGSVLRIDLGRQRTGRRVVVRWPRGTTIAPGRYRVRLHAKGPQGVTLRRRAHASGRATLTVRTPRRPAVKPTPPPPAPPASPVTPGGVFPVRGPHTYGDGIGAAREGHTHQGQDILAAEGTPVVAPLAGTISFSDHQKHGAGYYVVEHGVDGRDYFFAHCRTHSVTAVVGAMVAAGAQLCQVGHTGGARGPHLHFEIWVDGWRVDKNSHFIDPLPDLRAWDGLG